MKIIFLIQEIPLPNKPSRFSIVFRRDKIGLCLMAIGDYYNRRINCTPGSKIDLSEEIDIGSVVYDTDIKEIEKHLFSDTRIGNTTRVKTTIGYVDIKLDKIRMWDIFNLTTLNPKIIKIYSPTNNALYSCDIPLNEFESIDQSIRNYKISSILQ
jgi:hypothetical protein